MALQGDLAQMLCGLPIKIDSCKIAITQPTIQDICGYGEDNFFMAIKLLTETEEITKPVKQGNSQLGMLSDFQLLMVILNQDNALRESIQQFFNLIFPNYRCDFDNGSINFFIEEETKIVGQINPMNFSDLQRVLKELFLPSDLKDQENNYNPANKLAEEIAEKLKKGNAIRNQLKAEKGDGEEKSLLGTYLSILSIGLSMDIRILVQYTPFQLYDAFKRYTAKIADDFYQKITTTPLMDASKMKQPDSWMGAIYK